ncbi:response regulator receiver domain [Pseudomonas juntendi]|nr:response regulator receiver domain [Pseudomonas juntendi]
MMNNMESVAAVAEVPPPSAKDIWNEHIQSAVKDFLKTAVVIDNEPWVNQNHAEIATPEFLDNGLGEELPELAVPDAVVSENRHDLDVRAISDDFASKGIACAFVLPDDNDTQDVEKINRAVAAAKVSDLVIIDWYLKKQDESLTLQILQKISESDSLENGRLRLICIYTGEPLKSNIFNDAKEYIHKGGIQLSDLDGEAFCAVSANTIVIMRNKATTLASELPSELIKIFSRFADGLIPAFSMAAVGAIRKSAHHMLTRFGKWLDAAYVSNYIITNPPGDVSEMLRELFVAECDAALGIESVADRYLDLKPISKWLAANETNIQEQTAGKKNIDYALLDEMLRNGIKDDNYFYGDTEEIKIIKDHRHLISSALAGSQDDSKISQHEFARLVALKREAYGRSKLNGTDAWRPLSPLVLW